MLLARSILVSSSHLYKDEQLCEWCYFIISIKMTLFSCDCLFIGRTRSFFFDQGVAADWRWTRFCRVAPGNNNRTTEASWGTSRWKWKVSIASFIVKYVADFWGNTHWSEKLWFEGSCTQLPHWIISKSPPHAILDGVTIVMTIRYVSQILDSCDKWSYQTQKSLL